MSAIEVNCDPKEVGLDPDRLGTITRHFDGYVDEGRLAGYLVVVSRHGQVASVSMGGSRDREKNLPMTPDTIFRIYSMTKPITSIAAMRLWEEGRFHLLDRVARYIPSFAEPRIFTGGTPENPETRAAGEPILIWHLLSHMAGLTYGFQWNHPVDAIYRLEGFDWGAPKGEDLGAQVDHYASLPLIFEPGSAWNYSVATDVVGRLIEVITGEPLDVALRRLVLGPLGMDETGFCIDEAKADRLMQLYVPTSDSPRQVVPVPELAANPFATPTAFSGGGGLLSTPHDYQRFMAMLAHEGELDGVRLVAPGTLAMMASNALPNNKDFEAMAVGTYSGAIGAGIGFGLGFSVLLDPRPSWNPQSAGSYGWGGAASTDFWVDPYEDLEVAFYTQLLPSGTYPLSQELSQLVYSSITS